MTNPSASIIDFVTRGQKAQDAVDDALRLAARKPCPFFGCTDQQAMPTEVQAEQADGSHVPEVWFAVLCRCGTSTRPARTEQEASDNWNARAAT